MSGIPIGTRVVFSPPAIRTSSLNSSKEYCWLGTVIGHPIVGVHRICSIRPDTSKGETVGRANENCQAVADLTKEELLTHPSPAVRQLAIEVKNNSNETK